jgi:hypothetical protein
MKQSLIPLILAVSLSLAGCHSTTQTTSGAEYLSQYKYVPVAPAERVAVSADGTKTEVIKSIDQRIREAAAVEPVLKFPARIGLARIDQGGLTTIPVQEADGWDNLRKQLGDNFGEFVPVNPMVARMVQENGVSGYGNRAAGIVDTIRLGAARQHLDAVLIYEVLSKETSRSNILAVANASIIGGFILPSKLYDAEGFGNAILIDVVQGYPYGTINTTVEKKSRLSSSWGWGSDSGDSDQFAEKVKARAAVQLSEEAYGMFLKLRAELAERQVKSNPTGRVRKD